MLSLLATGFRKVFGSRNERMIKAYRKRVEVVNALEDQIRRLTDPQLRAKTQELRDRLKQGQRMIDLVPETLAVAREVMDRAVGIRNIFNPAHQFDPARLPAAVRPFYDGTLALASATPPMDVLSGKGQGEAPIPGWMQVDVPVALYEAVRQLYPQSRPPFRARPFDVQLIGGMVLWEGKIAEMKTGEGKTIVAPLACYLACVEGLFCHVVTVNDYLVQRDRDWVFPFFHHLGLSVGAIHPYHMQPPELKKQAYECSVVYGTNSEFGFDYLRDNMKLSVAEQVQKRRDFCIVDEVDSILIDEARTPLIISGPAHDDSPRYALADQLAQHVMHKQREWNTADELVAQTTRRIRGLEGDIRNTRDSALIPAMKEEMKRLQEQLPGLEAARDRHPRYYEVERERKAAHMTHEGIAEAQKVANIGSFYEGENMDLPHLLENSLRAHAVYQRDREYVVQNGEIIIVDEFTGRLMIGRQWSDGLHQAVEAKEKVKIKQETQTLATVTIQNFFKLYKRLAGMTGTALTEAQEFHDIYKLDVVSIPTNVPVIRQDFNDLVYISKKDKWNAILDEIKRVHDVGQPVLVGTTSVEHSETLSGLLTKKYDIRHEVLNAKQHEREAHIVAHAGELGAVMIATNMAGRGTDIKLAPIDRAALVRHWQMRNLLPKEAKAEMGDEEILALSWRHQYRLFTGQKPAEIDALSLSDIQLSLLRHWTGQFTYNDPAKVDRWSAEQCQTALDRAPGFHLHRLVMFKHMEEMGGLHIVGTERHEARRIDNQLRGRAGRQGDRGSSRFFISLEDDLMKIFAGKKTLAILSRVGMKEGDAIEHPMITRSVERAQRKVEERNFEIRKNLLEYDEVMEHQRHAFYSLRQEALEGKHVAATIFDYIAEAVEDAVDTYLAADYVPSQMSEWCRQELDVHIETYKLRDNDLQALQREVMDAARADTRQAIELTVGEYMSKEMSAEEWDIPGLQKWALTRFGVDLKQSQVRQMTPEQLRDLLTDAAIEQLNKKDLSGLAKFLVPHFAHAQLVEWAKNKFEADSGKLDLDPVALAALQREQVAPTILEKAREIYARREVEYPVEFALEMTFQAARNDPQWAAQRLADWVRRRYEIEWTPEAVSKMTRQEMYETLVAAQRQWLREGKLETVIDQKLHHERDPQRLADWAAERFSKPVEAADLADESKRRQVLMEAGIASLRAELNQLERFVLLQILDTCWKDHLYALDQLKDSVGLQSWAEKDPRIVYKKEGAALFQQMRVVVRDRVTDLIFRARLTGDASVRNVYGDQQAQHAPAATTPALPAAGAQEQREDQEAAQRAGADEAAHYSRKQRRAMAAGAGEDEKPKAPEKPRFKERKKRR